MRHHSYSLSFEEFRSLAARGNLIPLYREILADFETPVSAFTKINHGPSAYLLESVEGGENWARYSFLGSGSPIVVQEERGKLVVTRGSGVQRVPIGGKSGANPLERIRDLMAAYRPVAVPDLPRFVGGAVGYLGYDVVRSFEDIPARRKDELGLPELAFLLTDTLLIFDNVSQKIKVVANGHVLSSRESEIRRAYADATARIERMIARLKRPLRRTLPKQRRKPLTFSANMSRADFEKMVMRTKEYIRAGDVVQAVVSQRWDVRIQTAPLEIYRALRVINPSPYMYYLRVGGVELVGSSPETLVRCEDGRVSVRPIAGTRRRGATEEQDRMLERELLADEKERAEHVMLVDLGRNDVGRVARKGTVRVDAPGVAGERGARSVPERVRCDEGLLPGRHGVRRAQDSRDGNHRRTRADAARALRRRGGVLQLLRQHGHLHQYPHDRDQGSAGLHPGRGGDRGRLGSAARVRGDLQQGPGHDEGH